jgi:transcription initiation factor TFIID subunit 5
MERVLREQALVDRDSSMQTNNLKPSGGVLPGVVSPIASDLLPQPASFKAVDVNRELEKVKDTRKRIKLDPSLLSGPGHQRGRALPSICAYTLHDVVEGQVAHSMLTEAMRLTHSDLTERHAALSPRTAH